MEKVKANDNQIDALINSKKLKFEQAKNKLIQANLKVKSDSIDLSASVINNKIALEQLARMKELYTEGLKSLTDLETRKLKIQETGSQSWYSLLNACITFLAINLNEIYSISA